MEIGYEILIYLFFGLMNSKGLFCAFFLFSHSCYLSDAHGCMSWTTCWCPYQVENLFRWNMDLSKIHLLTECICPIGKSSQLYSHSLTALFEQRGHLQKKHGSLSLSTSRFTERISSRWDLTSGAQLWSLNDTLIMWLNMLLLIFSLKSQKVCHVCEDPRH